MGVRLSKLMEPLKKSKIWLVGMVMVALGCSLEQGAIRAEEVQAKAVETKDKSVEAKDKDGVVDAELQKWREERYQAARQEFQKNRFDKASAICMELIEKHQFSVALFELLGHIKYRQGKMGEAALWYERASLIERPSVELQQNKLHLQDRTGSVQFARHRFRDQFAAYFSHTEWFYLLVACGWVFVLALVLYYMSPKRSGRRTFMMLIRVLAAAGLAFAAAGLYWKPSMLEIRQLAVVTTPDVSAYTAAARTSGTVMNIPQGSQVKRLHESGAWTYVEIPTGYQPSRGWVVSEALTSVWPYDIGYLQ